MSGIIKSYNTAINNDKAELDKSREHIKHYEGQLKSIKNYKKSC